MKLARVLLMLLAVGMLARVGSGMQSEEHGEEFASTTAQHSAAVSEAPPDETNPIYRAAVRELDVLMDAFALVPSSPDTAAAPLSAASEQQRSRLDRAAPVTVAMLVVFIGLIAVARRRQPPG